MSFASCHYPAYEDGTITKEKEQEDIYQHDFSRGQEPWKYLDGRYITDDEAEVR